MSRTHLRISAAAVAMAALAACSDSSAPAGGDELIPALAPSASRGAIEAVMPGEVVIQVKDGGNPAEFARGRGLGLAGRLSAPGLAIVRVPVGNERAMAAQLNRDPALRFAEPNFLRQPHDIDPRLWAFRNPGGLGIRFTRGGSRGQVVTSYLSTLDADEDNIEGYAAGGAPVVVGSIDTGADLDHPELAGRTIMGRDWVNNDNDPSDDNGHGTHTSGTMAGSTVGVAGVAGAAANVKVHVQKVCGRRGCPSSAIASAIRAAADQPNLVAMNLSLGGGSLSQAEQDAIDYAKSKNVLVIASAGNSGEGEVSCPACDPDAISVAATNWRDELSYYTQFGPGLDISAPGGECYSNTTDESCIYSSYLDGGFAMLQGTSMAAPQVTGTAAIVASKTGLRGAALRARLESTTDDLGAAGYDQSFGNGRLNSYRAVTGSTLGGTQ
ncbi:MAG TPA: S8 family serine peptidase [Gemmatimonadales bacterium]|nr:S8 family serine peptidase [Gemmatimonadales bacterium]